MSSMYGHTPRNTEEQLHSQLQQLRVSLQETASQQQRLVGNLTAQGQKQDMRLQECECQKLTSLTVQSVDGSSDWPMVTAFIQRAAPKGLSVYPPHSSLEKESHREVYKRSVIPRCEPSNACWTLTNDYVVDESFGVIRLFDLSANFLLKKQWCSVSRGIWQYCPEFRLVNCFRFDLPRDTAGKSSTSDSRRGARGANGTSPGAGAGGHERRVCGCS